MKKPLSVGDRVAVYKRVGRFVGTILAVSSPHDDLAGATVKTDDTGLLHRVHPKQCRRLVPGKPRRRVWLVVPSYGCEWSRAYYDETLARQMPDVLGDSSATIQEFVEVRRKESK